MSLIIRLQFFEGTNHIFSSWYPQQPMGHDTQWVLFKYLINWVLSIPKYYNTLISNDS